MRNYRRLSGDGSVKVVLSGDSNSPPKTTRRREPLPCNSATVEELRTPPAFTFAFLRVHSRFQKNVDFPVKDLPKFKKKPVFAHIRGLYSEAGGSQNVHFRKSAIMENFPLSLFPPNNVIPLLAFILEPSALEQNVDFPRSPFLSFPSVPNPFKKARESAIVHVSTFDPSAPKSSSIRTLNLQTALRTSHQIPQKVPVFPHFPVKTFALPTSRSGQNVDWPTGDLALGNSLVITPWPALRSLVVALCLRGGTGGGGTLVIPPTRRLSLQKINFPVSATLKQPPLQMNDLRQFPGETAKNTETLKLLEHLPINDFRGLGLRNSLVIGAWTLVIPRERLYLQKNNSTFSCRPPLILHAQISALHFIASHQNLQKTPDIPRIPLNPTCPSHQNVDSGCPLFGISHQPLQKLVVLLSSLYAASAPFMNCGQKLFLIVLLMARLASVAENVPSPQEVLRGLQKFYAQTSREDGSFSPGIDPDYKGMSDSAYSDLAAVTYAVTIHKTFGWKLPREQETIRFLLSRQKENGDFFNEAGTVDPKSAEGRVYNTTQGIVALHALGLKPRYNPLPVFEEILKADYKTLPAYSTSFFPLAYLAYGVPIPAEADRRIKATMVQGSDGYLHDHIAATFHASHYYRLIGEPAPMAEKIAARALRDQKKNGSWLVNMPSRDRHATFDAVFTLRQLGGDNPACKKAIDRAAHWALSCRNQDGGFGHFPGSTSDADAIYFQVGVLVMAGYLETAHPADPQLLSWGHLMPLPK
jgi:hypothetical protein